ncbi:4-(cytidine 5'-diphospho)-2-C-methyl-D-erythritol kinase [Pararhizobium mangrovi]|uniref:4-diphosphocytidyl-2-C-methyl-D-erythritol kinase n=1 Tax=Pararhizobium mangrovi TaxID=2590452 RepID=A0A506U4Y2_9HYPH|nr:4-(cytidine 5'-diphospho)-2-C-methyl-D-erythritol kinase [Pararhizobium mangrovi]TPW28134.1 4-(cytidine 5'-diphospho)-2-C-methyl-D-erythritol kinase [Pararhizobium mangrovi]
MSRQAAPETNAGAGRASPAGVDPLVRAVVERAPAKINLALHVTGRRADGRHSLESLVTFANVVDRVHVVAAERDRFELCGPYASALANDPGNLVLAARDRLREALRTLDQPAPPVAITLEKNLPVASGIGGGSADAAATLRALARSWSVHMSDAEMADIAAGLGADVPMCLATRPLVATGVGERIRILSEFPSFDMVLVTPDRPVSTAEIFSNLDRRENAGLTLPPRWSAFTNNCAILAAMRNDLEATAADAEPAIGEARSDLTDAGARLARMSGSGATCFGLFTDAATAQAAALSIRRRRPGWFVADCRSVYANARGLP